MVNSINVCGRTLLETVQNLLDHAEREDSDKNYSTKTFPIENTVRITSTLLPSNPPSGTISATRFYNVALVTEELVETMFLGEARFDVSLKSEDALSAPEHFTSNGEITLRRNRFMIPDIGGFANLDFSIAASSYGRLVMNLLGNALKFTESGYVLVQLRSDDAYGSNTSISLKIIDSGIGIARDFLIHEAFEPFRKSNQHSPGTGVGLNVVKRIIEDVGGHIEISSEPGQGTEVNLKLVVERHNRAEDLESPHANLLASLSPLQGRKICILHSQSLEKDADNTFHWKMLSQYVDTLNSKLKEELKMAVTRASDWDELDESDVVICPEVSFQSLKTIQKTTRRKPPAAVLIAMDIIEANMLRCDARIMSLELVVEVMTQPCGPFKLGVTLRQCLLRYDGAAPNTTKDKGLPNNLYSGTNGSPLITNLGPKLSIYSSATFRLKVGSPAESLSPTSEPISTLLNVPTEKPRDPEPTQSRQTLIVDDNAVNRRLLSAFMKKRKMPFKEASNGLEALETYREAAGAFDVVLMDVSMPVMDGMTSTRLIREHEKEAKCEHAHIIALTGLTSASAKLEAWTSGVDDFLTKPVDFKSLGSLMEAGRGGTGTGFLKEQEVNVRNQSPDQKQQQ